MCLVFCETLCIVFCKKCECQIGLSWDQGTFSNLTTHHQSHNNPAAKNILPADKSVKILASARSMHDNYSIIKVRKRLQLRLINTWTLIVSVWWYANFTSCVSLHVVVYAHQHHLDLHTLTFCFAAYWTHYFLHWDWMLVLYVNREVQNHPIWT